jgi:hypothetical protein
VRQDPGHTIPFILFTFLLFLTEASATQTTATEDPTLVWATTRGEEERTNRTRTETVVETKVISDECETTGAAQKIEGNSLVLLQVNCRSILNKSLEFWNLIDTYNSYVIIGTESWLREDISNAELFRDNYTTFRRDRNI